MIYFSILSDEIDKNQVPDGNIKTIMNHKDTLFHYTNMNTAIEYILPMGELKANSSDRFGDYKERCDIPDNILKQWFDSSEDIQRFKEYSFFARIICFCSNSQMIEDYSGMTNAEITSLQQCKYYKHFAPHPGYDKDRMWEQYADKSSGVCLVFDKKAIKGECREINKQLLHSNAHTTSGNVRYYRNYFAGIQKTQEEIKVSRLLKAQKYIMGRLLNKHFDYRDENEYRIVVAPDHAFNVSIGIRKSLQGIIFGINMNPIYFDLFKQVVNKANFDNNIFYLKAGLNDVEPYYNYEKIDL